MGKCVSIAKPNENVPNEDAVFCSPQCIAVSDGAGGCGLYADEWSRYLIEHLPKDAPLSSFTALDDWVDGIWEKFYNEHEERAKEGDGILLNKFYNEGSYATIAAVWATEQGQCQWMTYGDSVVFITVGRSDCWSIALPGWPTLAILLASLVVKTPWRKKAFAQAFSISTTHRWCLPPAMRFPIIA